MSYFLAIFAGLIQGLTEFLPISSSGHLLILEKFFNLNWQANLFFVVMLHWGTLLALIIFFRSEIIRIIKGFFQSLVKWNLKNDFNQRLAWFIILATIPAALVGYFAEDIIVNYFSSLLSVALAFILVALLFFLAEKTGKRTQSLEKANWFNVLMIGLGQILAFVPGVSRSGITIVAGLSQNLKREEAARFSFLLALPVILGAGLKELFSLDSIENINFLFIGLGFLSALIFSYLTIKYILRFLVDHSLKTFAWYRLIIGCLILIWLILF